jgi:hypothetical protein
MFSQSFSTMPDATRTLEYRLRDHFFDSIAATPGSIYKVIYISLIFALDYPAMHDAMRPIREEILRHAMHPRNLAKARNDWLLIS